jgi:transcriptional regulator with XRE-family HTH domain
MDGEQIRRYREKKNISQRALSEILHEALGTGTQSKLSEWESGKRKIPEHVSVFMDALAMQEGLRLDDPPPAPPPLPPREPGEPVEDTAPRPTVPQPSISSSGIYSRVCEDLWEMIATGVGMIGALLGSDALMVDGRIIDEDAEALGKAYGKLAETNETFRRMLVGMTSSGAWLEIAMVTGGTVGKMYRNHQSELYIDVGSNGDQAAHRHVSEPASE